MKNKKFALLLFIVAFVFGTLLWFSLDLSTLFFGVEVPGQITDINITSIKTLREHYTVHSTISFQTTNGEQINDDYVYGSDHAIFPKGPIKVKYGPFSPGTYIFTEQNTSFSKFYSFDFFVNGMIFLTIFCLLIIIFSILGGLKSLGIDIIGRFISRNKNTY